MKETISYETAKTELGKKKQEYRNLLIEIQTNLLNPVKMIFMPEKVLKLQNEEDKLIKQIKASIPEKSMQYIELKAMSLEVENERNYVEQRLKALHLSLFESAGLKLPKPKQEGVEG